jgi:hypothetical protein
MLTKSLVAVNGLRNYGLRLRGRVTVCVGKAYGRAGSVLDCLAVGRTYGVAVGVLGCYGCGRGCEVARFGRVARVAGFVVGFCVVPE